jgi:hypothetical protein
LRRRPSISEETREWCTLWRKLYNLPQRNFKLGLTMKTTTISDRLGYKSFYRRNLPHIQPVDATLFLTFRLAGSLPKEVLREMMEERSKIEKLLKYDPYQSQSRFGDLVRRHFAMLEKLAG